MKFYHQRGANLNDCDKNVEFVFGENKKYHQIGNAFLQYEITVQKDEDNQGDWLPDENDATRLTNIAFAYCFKEARLSSTWSSDIEHNKYVGSVSTITRALRNKDGDLLQHIAKSDETAAQIDKTSLKHLLVNNQNKAANKSKIRGYCH